MKSDSKKRRDERTALKRMCSTLVHRRSGTRFSHFKFSSQWHRADVCWKDDGQGDRVGGRGVKT